MSKLFSNDKHSINYRGREVINTMGVEIKNKYNNQKTVVDGLRFDSKKEAKRWGVLKLLERTGEISDLQRQVKFELNEGGTHSVKYVADFVYIKDGKQVVEDCKGFRTAVYRKKKRLMKKVLGIEVLET